MSKFEKLPSLKGPPVKNLHDEPPQTFSTSTPILAGDLAPHHFILMNVAQCTNLQFNLFSRHFREAAFEFQRGAVSQEVTSCCGVLVTM